MPTDLKPVADLSPTELQREIAERLGWTRVVVRSGFLWGLAPNETTVQTLVPSWPSLLGEAWKLWRGMGDERELIDGSPDEECAATILDYFVYSANGSRSIRGYDPSPAVAICRAVVAYLREAKR